MEKYKVFKRTEKSRDPDHIKNEDKYLFQVLHFMNDEKLYLMILADGMGGLADGDRSAALAVKGFSEAIYQNILDYYLNQDTENFSLTYYADKVLKAVKSAFLAANQAVCDNTDPFVMTGTTLSVIAVLGNYAVVANMGDSPIYYYKKETDEFSLVSKLHTQAELDAECGVYERFSKEYYENDHRIYKSIGFKDALSLEEIETKVIGFLQSGDQFLIGSDGAFGRMKESEIWAMIQQESEADVLKRMFERAREDKDDDQTAILLKVC